MTTTRTVGPAPVVCFGRVLQHQDHPGVTFVLPYLPDTLGPQSSLGYSIPLVVVTADLSVEQVMVAAETVGATFALKQQLRKAVRAWAKSEDWRRNPHIRPSEQRVS